MNPMEMIKLKGLYEQFVKRHPRLPQFAQKAAGSIQEGTVIEISMTTPEGKTLTTNVRLTASDIQAFNDLK